VEDDIDKDAEDADDKEDNAAADSEEDTDSAIDSENATESEEVDTADDSKGVSVGGGVANDEVALEEAPSDDDGPSVVNDELAGAGGGLAGAEDEGS